MREGKIQRALTIKKQSSFILRATRTKPNSRPSSLWLGKSGAGAVMVQVVSSNDTAASLGSFPRPWERMQHSRGRPDPPLHTHQLVLISHNPITSHFICLTQRLRSKHFYWESCLTHVHAAPLTLKRMKPSPCACMSLHLGRFLAMFFVSIFASHKVRPADKEHKKNEQICCHSKITVQNWELHLVKNAQITLYKSIVDFFFQSQHDKVKS